MPDLNVAERHALMIATKSDLVGSWTNRLLLRLVDRKLLVEHLMRTPAGEISNSRRFVITEAGQAAVQGGSK